MDFLTLGSLLNSSWQLIKHPTHIGVIVGCLGVSASQLVLHKQFKGFCCSTRATKLQEKAYKPLILCLALPSALVTLLAKSTQKQSKQWMPLSAQLVPKYPVKKKVFNILSLSLAEEMPPCFLCIAVMQQNRPPWAIFEGSCCLTHSTLIQVLLRMQTSVVYTRMLNDLTNC